MLFPVTETYEVERKRKDEQPNQASSDLDERMIFFKQTVGRA